MAEISLGPPLERAGTWPRVENEVPVLISVDFDTVLDNTDKVGGGIRSRVGGRKKIANIVVNK